MNRMSIFALFAFAACAYGQAQTDSPHLIDGPEYKAVLAEIGTALPKWESDLNKIDPAKNSDITYALGNLIVQQRDNALMDVTYARTFIAQQQTKRTVYGELALEQFLLDIFDSMNEIESLENAAGVAPQIFEKYAEQLGALRGKIWNDAILRVNMLEKGVCTTK